VNAPFTGSLPGAGSQYPEVLTQVLSSSIRTDPGPATLSVAPAEGGEIDVYVPRDVIRRAARQVPVARGEVKPAAAVVVGLEERDHVAVGSRRGRNDQLIWQHHCGGEHGGAVLHPIDRVDLAGDVVEDGRGIRALRQRCGRGAIRTRHRNWARDAGL
jgi:hypothetical protein